MSILQDFEEIKLEIGTQKFDAIEIYLNQLCPKDKFEQYENELKKITTLPYEQFDNKIKALKKEYNVVLLDDVLYKVEEWKKFEKWYYEDYKKQKVEIISFWESDFDDVRCNANLYKNNKHIGNITCSFDGFIYEKPDDGSNKERLRSLIHYNFDDYGKLPKISKCSKLLQKVYDEVCESESSMCHITQDDWNEYYSNFSEKDVDKLKEEVEKYNLKDVVSFNEREYKILGWANLETCFVDDRNLIRNKDMER